MLSNKYRQIQSIYIDLKVKILSKKTNILEKNFNDEIKHTIEDTQEVANNSLFSIAAIFLGITLVSAMVAGIQYIDKELVILYFLSIGWVAITVLGIASIMIKRFNKKSIAIILIIALYTAGILAIGYNTYKNKEKRENDCQIVKKQEN